MPFSTVLLDSSAWIAFVLKEHEGQKTNLILTSVNELIVPFTVLEEIVAVLHHRYGSEIARKSADYLIGSHQCTITTLKKSDIPQIVDLWNSLPSNIDFVDASIVWLQQQTHYPILTLDTHFKKLGCKLATEL